MHIGDRCFAEAGWVLYMKLPARGPLDMQNLNVFKRKLTWNTINSFLIIVPATSLKERFATGLKGEEGVNGCYRSEGGGG